MKPFPSIDSIQAAQQGLPISSLQWLLFEHLKQPDNQQVLKTIKERFWLDDNEEIISLINSLTI